MKLQLKSVRKPKIITENSERRKIYQTIILAKEYIKSLHNNPKTINNQ